MYVVDISPPPLSLLPFHFKNNETDNNKNTQVLAVISEIPNISELVNSLYDCRYRDFMGAVVELNGQLEENRYFATHSRYLVRELRILAYTQFLDAYKSVVMATMAGAFGVGEPFLDRELSRFISAGRLNAKIDKVIARI